VIGRAKYGACIIFAGTVALGFVKSQKEIAEPLFALIMAGVMVLMVN
jgi:hypothetical protein